MDLESSVLDPELFYHIEKFFGTKTVSNGPRFEVLLPLLTDGGDRHIDDAKSLKIIASNLPRTVMEFKRGTFGGIREGIHYRVNSPDTRPRSRREMSHEATRRGFLQSLMRYQPVSDRKLLSALSDAHSVLENVVDFPPVPEGVVITGRGPANSFSNPLYFHLSVTPESLSTGHSVTSHPRYGIIPYFSVNGRDTAGSGLYLYRSGDSFLILTDDGGFFPRMWHADEIEMALRMKVPGIRPEESTDLLDSSIEQQEGSISLYHYTNGKPKRHKATRFIVGDARVRLFPVGDQGYHITADGTTIAEISVSYNLTHYQTAEKPETWEHVEGLSARKIREDYFSCNDDTTPRNFSCCLGNISLQRMVNPTDGEWAGFLAEYFTQSTPGMVVDLQGNAVDLSFDPFGINCTLRRKTTDEAHYFVNGIERKVDRSTFVPGFVLDR